MVIIKENIYSKESKEKVLLKSSRIRTRQLQALSHTGISIVKYRMSTRVKC